jgi:hypothetical protein
MKFLFIPFSIAASLLGGLLGRQLFNKLWGVIDEQEPPDGSVKDTTWKKLVGAAALQGAIFAGVRVATDRGARRAFFNLTGSWPGQQKPDPEN